MNNDKFSVSQIRLMRFLYALGFEKESYFDSNGKENWLFEKSNDLQKSLDFYFAMRIKKKEN